MSAHSGYAATIPSSEFRFSSTDGLRIACARWYSRVPVRGVVQIAHGMGGHIGRYAGTIDVLVSAGFTVYGNDHRGHGRTAPSARYFGDFGEGGFDLLVEDMVRLSRIARDENPEQPFFMLRHSLLTSRKRSSIYAVLIISGNSRSSGTYSTITASRSPLVPSATS
jgi:alpha-beta hydrolase superfamily lysophospholipase